MVDFRQIVAQTRAYNFHAHTQWCDGRDSLRDIARAALDRGYTHFGFTPHSPVPIESPCNMDAADLPAYRAEIDAVRRELDGRISIYCGVEIDYLGPQWGPASPMFATGNFDYSIGSVHFIPAPDGTPVDIDGRFEQFRQRMLTYFHDDIRYVVDTFFNQSHAMLDAGGFDILGHFDKIAQNASAFRPGIEDENWFRTKLHDYIDHILASGVVIEINTKSREQHGRFFPHERHWKRLLDAGATLLVNSDAHYADRIDSSRHEAFRILDHLSNQRS